MSDLVEEFKKTFGNESVTSLAEIWVFLNGSTNTCNHEATWSIMSYIHNKITMKECLRCWNTVVRDDKGRMTDEEFETWWLTNK